MCGFSAIIGPQASAARIEAMVGVQRHRGPDDEGTYFDAEAQVALGHNRLSVIDLSRDGRQPMASPDGRYRIVFNGELYNHIELRAELSGWSFRTRTDTEVVLAVLDQWGLPGLDRMLGMFAFVIWDSRERSAIAVRDRFGVKPLHMHVAADGTLFLASEIKGLHSAGVDVAFDESTWAAFLAHGTYGTAAGATFWKGIQALPAGSVLTHGGGRHELRAWYDLAARVGEEFDSRADVDVEAEYLALLHESLRLRFRADVPVGINLSGGLDSSLLLALVAQAEGVARSEVRAFTFATGDERYDELPWVEGMLAETGHPASIVELAADEVPALARSVQDVQDEPYGGVPTLAYAKLFEEARARGVIVLLDGQGMDEQWAGYDYYRHARSTALVQGSASSALRPAALAPAFRAHAPERNFATPFPDALRNLQHRDLCATKLPRALRFNDRVSMRAGCELREPFLDHRLVELALRQPPERKIDEGTGKLFLRRIAERLVPADTRLAPKRPVQTPQREWLRGPLRAWVESSVEQVLAGPCAGWFEPSAMRREMQSFLRGEADNSFFLWQWISVALLAPRLAASAGGDA